ncbi:expressed hypothetical protein [Trichoplax adhaerens]|uniref:Prostaglandin E synthase 2 n=1 Tax=Trichoplax adhaerens TaxID=10228 RepID=B3RP64_TRIAD|nr:expressed hypothetical protein [Trichoplax adhaerens]EDV27578.1 expressed hypothetical protein [Trichoplax adhaerens]|eukprot:XP_002109412.1 expressed hypothetical protein [Trichoplax adhaerens]
MACRIGALSSKLSSQSPFFVQNLTRCNNINSLALLKQNTIGLNSSTRLARNYSTIKTNFRSSAWGSKFAVAGGVALAVCGTAVIVNFISHRHQNVVYAATQSTQGQHNLSVKLYQYQNCPFCCKVRAFLNYYNIPYEVIEVNPLTRSEIKFSKYRKVPIVMVNDIQLNDSSLIVSVLQTFMLRSDQVGLDEIIRYYPELKSTDNKGKEKIEYANRYQIMLGEVDKDPKRKKENKWRQWVDDEFVHTLSPNIYRTPTEAIQAFDYFTEAGRFNWFERFTARYGGAIAMYLVSKGLKRKYNLKDDVRESMYDSASKWVSAVGKKEKFMGGDSPSLADLAVYGVLSAIEGLDAFEDLMKTVPSMKPWYDRTKDAVMSHGGCPKE